jgi:carboxynorspermidine decarboxylase
MFDPTSVETPCLVCDLGVLRRNLAVLADVQRRSGAKILLALKGFAMWSVFPLLRETLAGVAASSPDEARLGREEFGGEVHAYAPAYSPAALRDILSSCDHVVFNSLSQWRTLRALVESSARRVQCGIRVNPEHSEVEVPIYDPCRPNSRLGVTAAELAVEPPDGVDGLHFHTLCEQNADALTRTVAAVERKFGEFLPALAWVNFGGGHLITRPDYDVDQLIRTVRDFSQRYSVEVYLEPGEAVALDAGFLVASVLDILKRDPPVAILDTSASAHMPDVLEMPYRPAVVGADAPGVHRYQYRLGGLTCLAGDVIGDYSLPRPLQVGDRVTFRDMAHYTMVKSTCFNGVRLPTIATYEPETGDVRVVRRFGYDDYRSRLS